MNLRVASVFIMLEYQQYFESIIRRLNHIDSFEQLVRKTFTQGIWCNQIVRTSISILFNHPVWCLSESDNLTNPNNSTALPIIVHWNGQNHYSAIMPTSQSFMCIKPANSQEVFMPPFPSLIDRRSRPYKNSSCSQTLSKKNRNSFTC